MCLPLGQEPGNAGWVPSRISSVVSYCQITGNNKVLLAFKEGHLFSSHVCRVAGELGDRGWSWLGGSSPPPGVLG